MNHHQRDPFAVLLSTAAASFFSTTLTNTFQVRKLNQQFIPVACPAYPQKCDQSIITECFCSTRNIGRSFFNGLSVVVPQVLFSNIMFMQLYEYQKRFFHSNGWGQKHPTLSTVISASTSRTIISLITSPVEARRVRMSNKAKHSKLTGLSLPQYVSSVKVTLARDVSFSMLYWTIVQNMRNILSGNVEYRDKTSKSKLEILFDNGLTGMMAGAFVSLVTCPIDTVKTRVQTRSSVCRSIWREIKDIQQSEGTRGLFLGWQLRVVKSMSHSALYLVLFEEILSMQESSLQ